eukprot:1285955-Rhodomonas_salina.1
MSYQGREGGRGEEWRAGAQLASDVVRVSEIERKKLKHIRIPGSRLCREPSGRLACSRGARGLWHAST